MASNNFFKQLKAELHDHPYRDRYLEELQNHVEDLEKDTSESNKKLTDKIMKKRMGDAKTVKENFLNIMNPFDKLFFILEGLFYGLLFVPITFFIFSQLRSDLHFAGYWGAFGSFESLLATIAFNLLVLFVLYVLAYQRFEALEPMVNFKKRTWNLLLLGPGLVALATSFYFEITNEFAFTMHPVTAFLILLTYGLLHLITIYLASNLYRLKLKEKNKLIDWLKYGIKILAFTYFVLCVLYRTIGSHIAVMKPGNFPDSIAFLQIFAPLQMIEINFGRAWAGLMNSSLLDVNPFITLYLPAILILFVTAQSVWMIVRQKKWLNFRGLIVFYIVSLFFISPQHFVEKPDFKGAYINVSEMIEKKQVSIFYPILKYFNANRGGLFKYEVGYERNGEPTPSLVVRDNTGKNYHLNQSDLEKEKINFSTLIDQVEQDNPNKLTGFEDWENLGNMDEFLSNHLWSNQQSASDLAFSKDKKWALVVIPNEFYYNFNSSFDKQSATSPFHSHEVYLVKLKD